MNFRMSGRCWKSLMIAGFLGLPLSVKAGDTATVDSFHVASIFTSVARNDPNGRPVAATTIRFRLYVPRNYNPAVSYPLVITLHGSGEGGTDNRAQLKYRFNRMWADDTMQAKQPMFVLAPQSTAVNYTWTSIPSTSASWTYSSFVINPPMEAAIQLLDSLKTAYNIDTTKLIVSGLSAGGYATWYLLCRFPKRWAAALPDAACGDSTRAMVNTFLNTPIWIFHGGSDPTVNVGCGRGMIASLRAAYAAVSKDTTVRLRYSEYPGVGHNSWENASRDPRVMPWAVSWFASPTAIRQDPWKFLADNRQIANVKAIDILGRKRNVKSPASAFKTGIIHPNRTGEVP